MINFKNNNINFHQTFYPNFDYIGKILYISNGSVFYTIEEIAEITSIPTGKSSGKVMPHIKYAEYMNLITVKNKNGKMLFSRTILGDLIFREDPYFSEDISRLLCHIFLTSPSVGSSLWFFVYRNLQNKYGSVLKKDVVDHDVAEFFGRSTKLSAFYTAYSTQNSFGDLVLNQIDEDFIYFNEFDYNDEHLYGLLYTLFYELKKRDEQRVEFSVNELFNEIKWHNAINWSEKKVLGFLDLAKDKGWIEMNCQLNPITIILKKNINDLTELIYSELI